MEGGFAWTSEPDPSGEEWEGNDDVDLLEERGHPGLKVALLITKAELRQFQAAPLEAVVVSYWKEKGDTETYEVRIAKAPGKGRRLNVYYPDGDGKTASMLQWKQARVRAEIARTQTATPPKALPWPLEPAIQAAMEGEWQEHRRPLLLKKWERLFRWMHPDSREKV